MRVHFVAVFSFWRVSAEVIALSVATVVSPCGRVSALVLLRLRSRSRINHSVRAHCSGRTPFGLWLRLPLPTGRMPYGCSHQELPICSRSFSFAGRLGA